MLVTILNTSSTMEQGALETLQCGTCCYALKCIRSLNCNHCALCQFMELLALKVDVIILSEIWSTNINYHNILKGYTFYYKLPNETHIGGIEVFIINDFSHLERN